MKKILITPRSFTRYGQAAIKRLESEGYNVICNDTGKQYSYEEFCNLSIDAYGIILGVDQVDDNMLQKAKKLKGISRFGVGTDNIDLETAKKLGIGIRRTLGTNTTSVAELAISFFFILSKNLILSVNDVKKGYWNKTSGSELKGKTAGILGFGSIGKEVMRLAQGIGMKTIAYDPFIDKKITEKQYDIRIKDLESVLKDSDYITLHMPLNKGTKNMINTHTIQLMKPTSYLINTARGGLINTRDLYEALINGHIAGAAADVFSPEPPPADAPLLKLDNFILSPHIASLTKEAELRSIDAATENLLELLNTKSPTDNNQLMEDII